MSRPRAEHLDGAARRLRAALARPSGAVVVLVAVALALRLSLLGDRPAHWDEARVGWWVLHYRATGVWEYRPVLHGPFLFHVGRRLVGAFGASMAALRLPTALVGGVLPATALWYRDHLDDREVVALATVLAVAPLFVFYSRFLRNDLLLAAFSFAALGAALRARATGRWRHVLAAGLLAGLAFTTKENAVLYVLAWAGAATLVWLRQRSRSARPVLPSPVEALARLRNWWSRAAGAILAALAAVVWFYAPRDPGPSPAIGDLAADPAALPAVLAAATVDPARQLVELWVLGGLGEWSYPTYLGLLVGVLLLTAPATVALAAFGAAVERARPDGPRPLVVFSLAWAGLSVVGYPAAVDLVGGWTVLHVAVALAVPAAVGLAALFEQAHPALTRRRASEAGTRVAVAALLVVAAIVVAGGGVAVYAAPAGHWNPYPQPAQPGEDVGETARAVAAVADASPGTDVAYVGAYFAGDPARRMPLPWHVRAAGGSSVAVRSPAGLDAPAPPVVVATTRHRETLATTLEGYVCVEHRFRPWTSRGPGDRWPTESLAGLANGPKPVVVFVDRAALDDAYGSTLSSQRCG